MSPLGTDFPRERFLRTPVRVIRWTLRQLEDYEQSKANLEALTTARLTQVVLQIAHGFSGSKRAAPRITAKDFLPYPDWRPASQEADGPDQPTRFILSELGHKRQIPMHVLTALMTPADQKP